MTPYFVDRLVRHFRGGDIGDGTRSRVYDVLHRAVDRAAGNPGIHAVSEELFERCSIFVDDENEERLG